MTYLYIAISLYFISLLVAGGAIYLGAYKSNIILMFIGWCIGIIGEFSAVMYSIMWVVWLIKG